MSENKLYIFRIHFVFVLTIICLISCKKAEPNGDVLLKSEFTEQENWELYSEFSIEDSLYTRVQDGMLKLKTYTNSEHCQRATHFFTNDFSTLSEIRLAIYFEKLILPENTALHVYCCLGEKEFRAVIEKSESKPFTLWMKLKKGTLTTNLRGVIFDKTTAKKETDLESYNFLQISLCGINSAENPELIYAEIDGLMLSTK